MNEENAFDPPRIPKNPDEAGTEYNKGFLS